MRLPMASALALTLLARSLPAQSPDSVTITVQSLRGGVAMLTGSGGNIGVSTGTDGTVIVDDQFAPLTEKILAALHTLSPGPVRFVINTHWHGDHTGGNEHMEEAGALIVAHENVRRRMSTEQFIQIFAEKVPPSPEAALPVITFTDRVTFHWNGDEIRVMHVPHAHTDGDAIIWFDRADVVHMGDTFFNGSYPFIDIDTGGSIDGMIAAADSVLPHLGADTKVIPGHGPLGGKAELQTFRDMLVTVQARIAPLVRRGRTLAQIQAARPTAQYDEVWGKGFIEPDQFVAIVYQDLSRRRAGGR